MPPPPEVRNVSSPLVVHVTNLNDSGTGSFRDAVAHHGRIIVFDVGGDIQLSSPVSASYDLTILGQTAPGDGISISGAEVSFFNRGNVICRYVRFLDTTQDPGGQSTSNSSGNCLNLGQTDTMIFDHVSCEFASYNNIDAVTATNLTFQNSLVAAPITSQQFNFHWEGDSGTFINNVFVDGHNRSILAKGNAQYVNNTVYNYQAGFTSGNSAGKFNYDVVGNYFITGPSTTTSSNDIYQVDSNQSAYAAGNIRDTNNDGVLNGNSQNTIDSANVLASPFFASTANLPLLSAAAAYAWNIAHAGALLKHNPSTFTGSLGYDQVDQYMINEVKTLGTAGRMWSSETQDGLSNAGLGVVSGGSKPTDTDGDGIPDAYENLHGLSSMTADSTKRDPLGYTWIEHYANEFADQSTLTPRFWTSNTGEWSTASKWTGGVTPILYDIVSIQGNGSTNGLMTVTTSTPTAYQVYIGGNGPAAGEKLQVAGGTLKVYDTTFVGDTNNATLQIESGTISTDNIVLGNTLSGTIYNGTLLLNGGTLQIGGEIVRGGGAPDNYATGGIFNWNGGTIQATGTAAINVPITMAATALTFDTNGFNASITQPLSGAGASLVKIGGGTLTLSTANTYTGGTSLTGSLKLANNTAAGTGPITITSAGGTVQLADGITIANDINTNFSFEVLDVPDANATATYAGHLTRSGTKQVRINTTGSGATLNITGTISAPSEFYFSKGNVVVAGTGSITGGSGAAVGRGGAANLTVRDNANFNVGGFSMGGGQAMPSGTITVRDSATLSTGPANLDLLATSSATATSSLHLDGGTTTVGGFVKSSVGAGQTSEIDFNGGTLANGNSAENANFLPVLTGLTARVQAGGAKIDTNGQAITIAQFLAHDSALGSTADGGLTKLDTGTLTLTGSHTYTGKTTVNGGTLRIAGSIASSSGVTVNSGGTLDGTGTVAAIVLNAGGKILPGADGIGTLHGSSMTWNSDNSQSGALYELSAMGNTSDTLALTGTLSEGSGTKFLFAFSGGHVGTTYTLITYSSTTFTQTPLSTAFGIADTSHAEGYAGTFSVDSNSIDFTLMSVPEPTSLCLLGIGMAAILAMEVVRFLTARI